MFDQLHNLISIHSLGVCFFKLSIDAEQLDLSVGEILGRWSDSSLWVFSNIYAICYSAPATLTKFSQVCELDFIVQGVGEIRQIKLSVVDNDRLA